MVKYVDNTKSKEVIKPIEMVTYVGEELNPYEKSVVKALEICDEKADNKNLNSNLMIRSLQTVKSTTQETQYDIMRKFIMNNYVMTQNNSIYVYNGMYYKLSTDGELSQLILGQLRDSVKGRNSKFISGVIDFLTYEPEIAVKGELINKNIVAFKNGVLNIKTGAFYGHNYMYRTTYAIMANYLGDFSKIETPIFDSFLRTITGDSDELCFRILEVIGLCLTSDTGAKAIIVFQGVGNSGKSVLCKFMEKLFSPGAYYPMKAGRLKGRFALAELHNRILCVFNDMPNEPLGEKETSILKELSGNDTISSDVKFSQSITYESYAKIILTTNHSIATKTRDDAFYSRIVTVPFRYSIPKFAQDPDLLKKLLAEADGIVTKAMYGYKRLVENNYMFTGEFDINEVIELDSCIEASLSISIYDFVRNFFEVDESSFVFTQNAYEMFVNNYIYCDKNEFSQYFKQCAFKIYGVSQGRKRESSKGNPKHGVKGLKFRNTLSCIY